MLPPEICVPWTPSGDLMSTSRGLVSPWCIGLCERAFWLQCKAIRNAVPSASRLIEYKTLLFLKNTYQQVWTVHANLLLLVVMRCTCGQCSELLRLCYPVSCPSRHYFWSLLCSQLLSWAPHNLHTLRVKPFLCQVAVACLQTALSIINQSTQVWCMCRGALEEVWGRVLGR